MIVYLFIASGMFDLWSTVACCGAYPVYEENPVLRVPWILFGILGLVVMKILMLALIVWLVYLARKRYGNTWLLNIPLVIGIIYQVAAGLTNMAWVPYESTNWMFRFLPLN